MGLRQGITTAGGIRIVGHLAVLLPQDVMGANGVGSRTRMHCDEAALRAGRIRRLGGASAAAALAGLVDGAPADPGLLFMPPSPDDLVVAYFIPSFPALIVATWQQSLRQGSDLTFAEWAESVSLAEERDAWCYDVAVARATAWATARRLRVYVGDQDLFSANLAEWLGVPSDVFVMDAEGPKAGVEAVVSCSELMVRDVDEHAPRDVRRARRFVLDALADLSGSMSGYVELSRPDDRFGTILEEFAHHSTAALGWLGVQVVGDPALLSWASGRAGAVAGTWAGLPLDNAADAAIAVLEGVVRRGHAATSPAPRKTGHDDPRDVDEMSTVELVGELGGRLVSRLRRGRR